MTTGRPRAHTRPATMSDLARIAGVSITTVSHVVNETRFVSEGARRRVLEAEARAQNLSIPSPAATHHRSQEPP